MRYLDKNEGNKSIIVESVMLILWRGIVSGEDGGGVETKP